jgi:hypothetical protein
MEWTMNPKNQADENLLVVWAVEEYARRQQMPASAVFALFTKFDVIKMIRASYDTLHTQALDESYYFAEAIVKRNLE